MPDETAMLRRRVARERAARQEAERIAETKIRELYQKGQALKGALAAEQRIRADVETLLRALETFTKQLEAHEIVEGLVQFAAGAFTGAEVAVHLQQGGATVAPHTEEGPRSRLVLPIVVEGAPYGVLTVEHAEPGVLGEEARRFASALVRQAATALERARLFREVERLSRTDPLTSLNNRRHFDEMALRELALAVRHGHPLAALMLDVDHFKAVNDTHGHGVGDRVLVELARTCLGTVRRTDVCARLGGEEFCILLPETGVPGASALAERLRSAIARLTFEGSGGSFSVTVSLGIAEIDGPEDTLQALLARSDEALYAAKEGGRDRVVVWTG